MAYDRQKVIDIALAEVGYLEKATYDQLDEKTANAGKKNYTKYARDLAKYPFYNGTKKGVAWCDVFVDWCFVQAYGKDAALELTFQPTRAKSNCGAGCRYSRNYYKKNGQLFDTPQPGDQVFFWPKDRSDKNAVQHTGLVYKVDSKKVYTVEGNTSGASGVIANGGGVCKKSYPLTYSRLAGFGRPKWGSGTATEAPATKDEQEPAKESTTATVGKTEGESVMIELSILRKGSEGPQVKTLQRILNARGYKCGSVDGKFGNNTLAAVKKFQKAKGLTVDGDVGKDTWTALLTQ